MSNGHTRWAAIDGAVRILPRGLRPLLLSAATALAVALPASLQAAATPPRGIAFAEDFAGLPLFKRGVQTYQFSSTDPAEDQFNDFSHWLRTDENGDAVLADIEGPGCLQRIWSTGNDGTSNRIQIYLDGQTTPFIDETFDDFHNRPPLRDKPQVGAGGDTYRAWWSYLPITFAKSCRVVRQGNVRPFHSITYHTFTTAEGVTTSTGQESVQKLEQMWSHPDQDPKPMAGNQAVQKTVKLQPGERQTVFSRDGSGHIASLRIENYLPEKGLKLRLFWDGDSTPAVDAPVKWFFGSVDNGGDLRALGVGTVANNGYCYFPMPFWHSARIELVNTSEVATGSMRVEVQYNPRAYPEDAAGYFRVQANEADRPGDRYTCLRTHGRGHVIGMAKRMPAAGHACEADEIFFIDGRRFPDLYGTGEEDYNNCAWWKNSYNSFPTHGCIGNDCYYRLHYPDVITFEQAIDLEFESWEDFYIASLVWYYAKDRAGLTLTDSVNVKNADSEAQHAYAVTDESWAGEKSGVYPGKRVSTNPIKDDGRAFSGTSEFTVKITPENQGVRLRLRTEHMTGPRVNVWIDGERVMERGWLIAKNPYDALWIDSDFEIPAHYTAGKTSLRIKLEHVEGTPDWSEYRYDVFSYR